MTSTRKAIALAISLTLPGLAAGQGLGAAAAKEKQRRASGEKSVQPAKTYTDESLKDLPPVEGSRSSSSSGASSSGASGGTAEDAKGSTAEDAKGSTASTGEREEASGDASEQPSEERDRAQAEVQWRARVATARARIDRARENVSYYESLNLVPGVRYVDEKGATVIESVQELQGLTRKAKADLAAAEKALEDLLEEARRASVPPGWLR